MGDIRLAATLVVFAFTWWSMAVRAVPFLPLGRAAGTLLGAVLMVAIGALTPDAALGAVDLSTLALLLGMMIQTDFLAEAGVFGRVADALLTRARTPFGVLAAVATVSAALSAFLVNDTVCLFLTPAVVVTCVRGGLPLAPYLLALATSANIGSAATLVGNPQNMLIGRMSGLPFAHFAALAAPATLAGFLANLGLLHLFFARTLPAALRPAVPVSAPPIPRAVTLPLLGTLIAFFAGAHLGFAALAGACGMLVAARSDARPRLARLDWSLLLFFAGLFIVVRALEQTGLVAAAWAAVAGGISFDSPQGMAGFSTAMLLGSNIVSNVPLVLLLGPHMPSLGGGDAGWVALAWVTTVAGNLTLVGSVANLIVAEGARDAHTLGFREHLRFGLPSTLLVTLVGLLVLHVST
jgi:Na+/H+ antiporter NhaD/arsenite permease-like protein